MHFFFFFFNKLDFSFVEADPSQYKFYVTYNNGLNLPKEWKICIQ